MSAFTRPSTFVALLLVAFAFAACGSDGDTGAPARGAAPDQAFPVTIEHDFGATTIPQEPRRVVTVGYNEQDFVLALGVQPVGVREWFGDEPSATWPWAREALGDAKPTVLPAAELNLEQIAGLRPDLILGIHSGMSERDYERLSKIAPTVVQSGDHVAFGVPWQEQTLTIGRALGRAARAQKLVDDLEARFATLRDEHPEFAEATALFAYREGNGSFGAYASSDPRGQFLTALGFRTARDIDELAGDQFFAGLSGERLRLLDRDALVMIDIANLAASREQLLEDPLYRRLDVVRDGRDVYPASEVAAALSFSSPLSLPVAIDGLVPELVAAVAREAR